MKVVNLIDFDELDQMSEGRPEGTLNVFFEINLIDFGCIEEELVRYSDIKEKAVKNTNSKTFRWFQQSGDVDNANRIVEVTVKADERMIDESRETNIVVNISSDKMDLTNNRKSKCIPE